MKSSLLLIILLLNYFTYAQQKQYALKELMGIHPIAKNSNFNNLNPEAYKAFLRMRQAARKQQIEIQIVSGYRSFKRQHQIFKKKYKKYQLQQLSELTILKKIVEYSTLPGTSRHHWGTDIDIVQKLNTMPKYLLIAKNYEEQEAFHELKQWMDEHAHEYGFYLTYTSDPNRSGFNYEPWHYTYAPVAKAMLKQFLEYHLEDKIYETLTNEGVIIDSQFFNNYIETHIKGINIDLLVD